MMIPAAMVMNRYHGMNVSPMWNPVVPKNVPMLRVVFGFQMIAARPMRASITPIVVTSWATRGASASGRIRNRSRKTPNSGAATRTVRRKATSVWMPRSTLSSQ